MRARTDLLFREELAGIPCEGTRAANGFDGCTPNADCAEGEREVPGRVGPGVSFGRLYCAPSRGGTSRPSAPPAALVDVVRNSDADGGRCAAGSSERVSASAILSDKASAGTENARRHKGGGGRRNAAGEGSRSMPPRPGTRAPTAMGTDEGNSML